MRSFTVEGRLSAWPFAVLLAAFPHSPRPRSFHDIQLCNVQRLARGSLTAVQYFDGGDAFVLGVVNDDASSSTESSIGTFVRNSMFKRSWSASYSICIGFYPSVPFDVRGEVRGNYHIIILGLLEKTRRSILRRRILRRCCATDRPPCPATTWSGFLSASLTASGILRFSILTLASGMISMSFIEF